MSAIVSSGPRFREEGQKELFEFLVPLWRNIMLFFPNAFIYVAFVVFTNSSSAKYCSRVLILYFCSLFSVQYYGFVYEAEISDSRIKTL